MNDDSDDDEDLLQKISNEVKEERSRRDSLDMSAVGAAGAGATSVAEVRWLNGSSLQVFQTYVNLLATASDVQDCIQRMRWLADSLMHEADKLEAKGAVNFQQSFDLH